MIGIITALVVLPPLCAVYWLFFRVSLLKNVFSKSRLESRYWEDIPFITQNGLPYHCHFNRTNRRRIELKVWDFGTEGDSRRKEVSVPHCFNTAGSSLRDYEGPVVYSCTVNLKERASGCQLVFMGSFYKTSVFINDRLAGTNEGGYLPFRIAVPAEDSTSGVLRIRVVADNRVTGDSVPSLVYPGHAMGFHPYGGLHKSVYLEYMPAAYIFKAHAHTDLSDRQGSVRIETLIHCPETEKTAASLPSTADLQMFSPDGAICFEDRKAIGWNDEIGGTLFNFAIENPAPWNSVSPSLYRAVITVGDDVAEIRFGFTSLKVREEGFFHNGAPVVLKGACRHEEELSRGLAQSHQSMDKDLSLAKEMGMNYLRLSHYPHDSYFLDRSDEEGIIIWEEIPLYQSGLAPVKYIADKSLDRRDPIWKQIIKVPLMIARTGQLTKKSVLSRAYDDLIRMIERDFNHPSIRFWGIGNECWTLNPAGARALKKLKAVVQSRDPSRLAAYAAMTIPGLTALFERAFKVMDFIGVNEYFGWYYGEIGDLEIFLDKIHRKQKRKPIMITETGPDCAYGQRSGETIPEKGVTEEYQARYLKEQFGIMKGKSYFAGLSIWVLKDFLCPEYGTDNIVPNYNLKGLFSASYERKAAADTVRDMYKEEE